MNLLCFFCGVDLWPELCLHKSPLALRILDSERLIFIIHGMPGSLENSEMRFFFQLPHPGSWACGPWLAKPCLTFLQLGKDMSSLPGLFGGLQPFLLCSLFPVAALLVGNATDEVYLGSAFTSALPGREKSRKSLPNYCDVCPCTHRRQCESAIGLTAHLICVYIHMSDVRQVFSSKVETPFPALPLFIHISTVTTFKYVEGGPDREAPEGTMKYQFVYFKGNCRVFKWIGFRMFKWLGFNMFKWPRKAFPEVV
jgi:hypothetical protein